MGDVFWRSVDRQGAAAGIALPLTLEELLDGLIDLTEEDQEKFRKLVLCHYVDISEGGHPLSLPPSLPPSLSLSLPPSLSLSPHPPTPPSLTPSLWSALSLCRETRARAGRGGVGGGCRARGEGAGRGRTLILFYRSFLSVLTTQIITDKLPTMGR